MIGTGDIINNIEQKGHLFLDLDGKKEIYLANRYSISEECRVYGNSHPNATLQDFENMLDSKSLSWTEISLYEHLSAVAWRTSAQEDFDGADLSNPNNSDSLALGYRLKDANGDVIKDDNGNDKRFYFDATEIPYFVIPVNNNNKVMPGDVGFIYNEDTYNITYAIYADKGPASVIGELSNKAYRDLNLDDYKNENLKTNYVVFPGSGKLYNFHDGATRTAKPTAYEIKTAVLDQIKKYEMFAEL